MRVHDALLTGLSRLNSAGKWKTGGTDVCRLGAIAPFSISSASGGRDRRDLQEADFLAVRPVCFLAGRWCSGSIRDGTANHFSSPFLSFDDLAL